MFISKREIISVISEAILNRQIVAVKYQHTSDGEIVQHELAPFDIGSANPNPKIQLANAEKLYAYSYTHRNKDNRLDPKVCAFNINYFIEINSTGKTFDETELTIKNFHSTKYDYRNCNFALLPKRDWFKG